MSLSRQLLALALTTQNNQEKIHQKKQKVTLSTTSIYNKQTQEHTKPLVSKPTSENGGD